MEIGNNVHLKIQILRAHATEFGRPVYLFIVLLGTVSRRWSQACRLSVLTHADRVGEYFEVLVVNIRICTRSVFFLSFMYFFVPVFLQLL